MLSLISKLAVLGFAALASATPVTMEARQSGNFRQEMLDAHNFFRAQHGANPVTWNDDAAAVAQNWANQCQWQHQSPGQTGYGECLAGGTGFDSWHAFVNGWGHERVDYDWNNPGFSGATGHFTQVVWKNTNSIGCAWKDCGTGNPEGMAQGFFIVCEYAPPGNYLDQFADQVGRQEFGNPEDVYNP